jgi:hypothetical protein
MCMYPCLDRCGGSRQKTIAAVVSLRCGGPGLAMYEYCIDGHSGVHHTNTSSFGGVLRLIDACEAEMAAILFDRFVR